MAKIVIWDSSRDICILNTAEKRFKITSVNSQESREMFLTKLKK